jgi:outer membrane lipoprotein-sorting protein
MKLKLPCSTLLLVVLGGGFNAFPLSTSADDDLAARKGLEIATESKLRDTGYEDFVTTVTMTLKNKQGQSSTRKMTVKTLEELDKGEKALILFTSPADSRGTALLSYSFKEEADKQWIYLPSIKRVKRIASGNKTGSFVGSEFSYADISPQQLEKYTYKFLKEEKYQGMDCFVFERFPKEEKNGYSKQVIWMDKEHYRPWKAECYDRKDKLLKTLTTNNFNRYKDRFWRPTMCYMENHQTGKSTTIEFHSYKFQTGLQTKDFDRSVLKRLK